MPRFYVTEKLGKKRSKTPEGFLLCEDVPIARTGLMIYGPDETPIAPGPDGVVRIFREEQDVFHPDTIASFNGKSVTMEHPDEDVTPDNWKELTCGVVMNPHRGEGVMDDLLLADMLLTREDAIKWAEATDSELPEVSCGYDVDYEESGPGVGFQRNIIGNHLALVKSGRCGPRCAIGDQSLTNKQKENTMAKEKGKTLLQRALDAFHAKDEAALAELIAEKEKTGDEGAAASTGGGDTHIHLHTGPAGAQVTDDETNPADPKPADPKTPGSGFDDETEARFASLEAGHSEILERLGNLEKLIAGGGAGDGDPEITPEIETALRDEAPEGMEEEAVKAKDSKYLDDSFRTVMSMAEILAPGIKAPAFDSAAHPAISVKKLCAFRRSALDAAYATPEGHELINEILGGKKMDTVKMTCDAARTLFNTAASVKGRLNSGRYASQGSAARDGAGAGDSKGIRTIAQLNAANKSYWENKNNK